MNEKQKPVFAQGLGVLCNQPAEPLPQVTSERTNKTTKKKPGRPKSDTITVCYNIDPEMEMNVKYMAYRMGKTKNAIVEEALREYWDRWQDLPKPEPLSREAFEAQQEQKGLDNK